MQQLTGCQHVIGYANNRSEVWRIFWAGLCLLVRGKIEFKMSIPPQKLVLVPDHCRLIPAEESSHE